MTCVLLISALLLVAAWLVAVRPRYPLTGERPERLWATTGDGWQLAVWHRAAAPTRRFREPVVLCHGLANNHAFFEFQPPQNLALALSRAGFECYTVDLRGAGDSRPPHEGPFEVSFDDHVQFDVPAILELVCALAGTRRVLWVGHSLGGLVGLAASGSALKGRLAALCTIGSPAFFKLPRRTRILLTVAQWLAPWGAFHSGVLWPLAPLAGRFDTSLADASANLRNIDPLAQRRMLANVFAPIWRGVLEQLDDWSKNDAFRSKDGVDYREAIRALDAPTLVVGGTVDGLAPEDVTRALHAHVTAEHCELAVFGRAHGHREDYGHGDLIIGKHAHEEVYPVITGFLARHASPVEP